jgi:hypothetical protein
MFWMRLRRYTCGLPTRHLNSLLKNVFEAADARQKTAKKRSLHRINEHFEPVFNAAAATQIVFQQAVKNGGYRRFVYGPAYTTLVLTICSLPDTLAS